MESRRVKILYNDKVSENYRRLGLEWKTPAITPGQFVMVRVSDGLDPLLRRPFGIHGIIGQKGKGPYRGAGVELLFKVVGKGTKMLSGKEAGESVDILGPLGNGFPDPPNGGNIVLVAGGMGIAPMHLLAKRLKKGVLLYGVRGRAEAVFARDFKEIGYALRLSSEDGSVGKKGLVTYLLEEELKPDTTVYACGPAGMLKAVAGIAARGRAGCFVSLERSMACGIGVCLGCAVKSKKPAHEENRAYRMVCSEGPVFDASEIDWEAI